MARNQIDIEGYTPEEILGLPDEQLDAFVLAGEPLVFRAGSAEILGEFKVRGSSLFVELAQIDGGGEGVLPALTSLAQKYARKRGLKKIEWVVHAINCAKPNLKLRRVMERRGFVVTEVKGVGQAYYLVDEID
jgi:hypothetical protein